MCLCIGIPVCPRAIKHTGLVFFRCILLFGFIWTGVGTQAASRLRPNEVSGEISRLNCTTDALDSLRSLGMTSEMSRLPVVARHGKMEALGMTVIPDPLVS